VLLSARRRRPGIIGASRGSRRSWSSVLARRIGFRTTAWPLASFIQDAAENAPRESASGRNDRMRRGKDKTGDLIAPLADQVSVRRQSVCSAADEGARRRWPPPTRTPTKKLRAADQRTDVLRRREPLDRCAYPERKAFEASPANGMVVKLERPRGYQPAPHPGTCAGVEASKPSRCASAFAAALARSAAVDRHNSAVGASSAWQEPLPPPATLPEAKEKRGSKK